MSYSTGFTGEPRPSRNQTGCPAIAAGFSEFDLFEVDDVFFDCLSCGAACLLVRRARSNKLAIRTNSPRDSNTPRELAHRTRALNTRFDELTALSSPLRQGRLPRCAARMRFRTGFEPAKSDQALKVRVAIEEAANKEGLLSKKLRFERSKVFSDSVGTLPGSFGALKSGWSFSLCQCKPSARDLQKIAHLSTGRHSCLSQRALQTMTVFCSDAQFPCSLFPCFF